MINKALLSHLLVLGAWLAIIGIRPDADAATRRENARHLDVLGLHQGDEVFHDDVDTVLVKVAMVAEAEEIKLQAFALHHLDIRNVADANLGKIGLSRDGTQRCELGAVETHPLVIALVLVDESLEHLGRIIHLVLGLGTQCLQTVFFSIHILVGVFFNS